ncbi:MAG: DUF6894 family protein [Devosia sp.]
MPRYFFDIVREDLLLRDQTGAELPDMESARQKALRDLARFAEAGSAEELSVAHGGYGLAIEVRGASNRLLARLVREPPHRTEIKVAASPRDDVMPADQEPQLRLEEALSADLARWVSEQRRQVEQSAAEGQNTEQAEKLLKSVTDSFAERIAHRIRKAVNSG